MSLRFAQGKLSPRKRGCGRLGMTTLGTVAAWLKPCPSQVLRPVSFLPSLRDSLVLKLTQDLRPGL